MTTFFPKPLDKQVAAISDSVSQTQDGLAIVANGNNHAAISSGQFVYVKNHDTLAEGLYKATASISANGSLSTSNLTADGTGGLNDLQGQVTALNSNINSKLNAGLLFTASSNSDFLSQILDYAVSLGNAGSRIVGITWQQHCFCIAIICSQSATRHVATVVPQPGNESNIFIAEYNGGTKTYKQIAMTQLS